MSIFSKLIDSVVRFPVHEIWTIEAFARHDRPVVWRDKKLMPATPNHLGVINMLVPIANGVSEALDEILSSNFQVMIEPQSIAAQEPGRLLVFAALPRDDIRNSDPVLMIERTGDGWKVEQ